MQKIWDTSEVLVKNAFNELKTLFKSKVFYVYLLISALIIPSIFFDGVIFVVLGIAFACSIIFKEEDVFALLMFLYPFFAVFISSGKNWYFYLFAVSVAVMSVKFLIKVFKKQKTIDWFVVCLIAAYVLFLILPIRKNSLGEFSNNCNITNISSVGVFFVALYLCYKNREKINFLKIVRIFVIGFIVSGLFGLLVFCSDKIQSVMALIYYHGFDLQRYNGLFVQPNTLAIISSVVFALVLYLFYNKKFGLETHVYLIASFTLGYVTLARSFLYAAAICFAVYLIAEIVRDKKNFYKFVLPFVIEIGLVMLICFAHSKVHFQRAGVSDLVNGYENVSIENPTTDFVDPGRGGLIKIYLKDFLSSVLVILFGRGISYEWFGTFSSHNTYLQAFWNTGVVGVVLLLVIACAFVKMFTNLKFKNLLKEIFTDLSLYFLLIPILAIMFIENLFMNMQMIIVILSVVFAIIEAKRKMFNEQSQETENIEEKKKI